MTLILIPFNELMTEDPTEPVLPVVPKPVKDYLTGMQWKEIKKRLKADIGNPNEISNFALIAVFAPCLFLCIPSYNTVVFQQKATKSCTDLNTELFSGKNVLSVDVSGLYVNPDHLQKISEANKAQEPQITVITPDRQEVIAPITPPSHTVKPTPQEQSSPKVDVQPSATVDKTVDSTAQPAAVQEKAAAEEGKEETDTNKLQSSFPESAAMMAAESSTKSETDTDTPAVPVATESPTSVLVASAPETSNTPAIKTMSVEIPEGVEPGSTMTVMAPDDITQVVVAVPDDAVPGQTIEVEY